MAFICPRAALFGLVLLVQGLAVEAANLPDIRYRLHQDSQADVEADLRQLAERGDRPSQLLLAARLAGSADAAKVNEAMALYKGAFDDGRGEIDALAALARLSEHNPLFHTQNRPFIQHAIGLYPPARDFGTLTATLDTFLVYPDEFEIDRIAGLIRLYERACVENCLAPIYHAALAERQGDSEMAESYYRRAIPTDPRAVARYYRILGPLQDSVFKAYAQSLEARMQSLPVPVVQAIGSHLSGLSTENDPAVVRWLDNAIARGAEAARIIKVSYMISFAASYSAEEALALIDLIEAKDPHPGRALRASVYMVRNWPTLDPFKAHELIRSLLDEGYQSAYLNLGELYSMGGLDQVDQLKAIETYKRLAAQGSASAFYRIASIYGRGRGICNDKVRAYAYASMALDFGELGAAKLLQELEADISQEGIAQALQLQAGIIEEVKSHL
ncbi:MAG: sel1 repeat family protein [Pseudomonadota bacterium]